MLRAVYRAPLRPFAQNAHDRRHPLRQRASTSHPTPSRRSRPACGGSCATIPAIHLQGHGELHRRARRVAIIDPGPDDEAHMRGAARRGARRDRDAHLRHPYPSRSFARRGAHQGGDRRDRLCRRSAPRRAAAVCRRGQCGSKPAATRDFRARRAVRATATSLPGPAGPSKRSRRPAIPPTTWRSRSRRRTCCSQAITSWRWSTPIVAPPDGAMSDYMASLRKARAPRGDRPISPATAARCGTRRASCSTTSATARRREESILHRLAKGAADIPTLVRAIYIGLDPRLARAAGLSVLAHLEDLVARGLVATDGRALDRGSLSLGRRLTGLRQGRFLRHRLPASAFRAPIASSMSSIRRRHARALVPKSYEP